MVKITLLSIMLFFVTNISAASQITHAYLADCWLSTCNCYDETYKRDFMIGTLFPDIRHLAHSARTSTHHYGIPLKKIARYNNAFLAGKQFHSWVDEIRERYVKKSCILKHHGQEFLPLDAVICLKMLEDEIFYPAIDKRKIQRSVCHIDPQEYRFDIKPLIIQQWHRILKNYFNHTPHITCITNWFLHKNLLGFSSPQLKQLSRLLKEFSQQRVYIDHVQGMKKIFNKHFKHAAHYAQKEEVTHEKTH